MVSLVTVIAVCMFLILAGMVANVAQVVRAKIVAQNAADGVAQSVALVRARGLNAITAANHLIGELEALVILHHAVGGDKLDRGARSSPDSAVLAELDMAYEAAAALEENEFLGPDSEVKSAVAEMPKGGATLKDSVIRLQQVLAWTYEAMAVGGALQKLKSVPYIGPFAYGLGLAINGAAKIYETKISLERKILTGLENLAGSSPVLGLKKALDQGAIQALHRLSLGLASENGGASRTPDVVEAIAEANAVADAASFPRLASPPARPEPDRVEPLANSQLVRSSYPWVNHWRSPILKFMKNWLILSRAHKHYHFYTDQFTEEKCREQKEQRGVHLLVLEDYDPNRVEKGGERWTFARGSDRADELFGAVGAARRPPPRLVSPGIFERANPDGVVAHAQALTYNANPQRRGSGGETQPVIGWDTLNWGAPVPEYRPVERSRATGESVAPSGYPRITLNWRAKLAPTTAEQLERATSSFADRHPEIHQVLRRALRDATTDQFRTH